MGDRDADEVDRAPDDLVRFAALVELSADFIAMALPDGTVAYVNAAGRELVGVGSLEEAVARSTDDYFSEVGRELSHEIEAAVRTRGHWEGESHLRHFPTGEAIPVSVNSFLVTHPQTGEPLALATVQRDLHPRSRSSGGCGRGRSGSNAATQNSVRSRTWGLWPSTRP